MSPSRPKFPDGPQWRDAPRLPYGLPAGALRRWLLDPSSLTRRLQAACDGGFGVVLLEQGWARPLADEADALALRPRTWAWVREVVLTCDRQGWVFARTVIPAATLRGPRRRLTLLGQRPLGAMLFADPSMSRDPVEVARVRPGHRLWHRIAAEVSMDGDELWGRRSLFRLQGRPLLVSEFFIPGAGLWRHPPESSER